MTTQELPSRGVSRARQRQSFLRGRGGEGILLPGCHLNVSSTIGTWRIDIILMSVAIFSSSFDIFANVMVGSYNVRLTQLALLPIVALAFIELLRRPLSTWPQGYSWLVLWCIVQLVFCMRSPSPINAVGYEAWLIFDALTIAGFTFFIKGAHDFRVIARVYLVSFLAMAVFGLVQFCLYFVGINLFVTQVWVVGQARINGFSFEPSYYSTYMLLGFVVYAYLVEKGASSPLSRKTLLAGLALITIAIVLSTSRMGILMVFTWVILRCLLAFARGSLGGRRISRVVSVLVAITAVVAAVFLISAANVNWQSSILRGLGVAGADNHSSGARIQGLANCIAVFAESPFVGYSLGGVDPVLAKAAGEVYVNGENGSAMSIIGEMLVANGLVGLVPVVAYILTLVFCRRKLVLSGCAHEGAIFHKALVWALVFELAILCFNQNILRSYLWIHLAIMGASWCVLSTQKVRKDPRLLFSEIH